MIMRKAVNIFLSTGIGADGFKGKRVLVHLEFDIQPGRINCEQTGDDDSYIDGKKVSLVISSVSYELLVAPYCDTVIFVLSCDELTSGLQLCLNIGRLISHHCLSLHLFIAQRAPYLRQIISP